MRGPSSSHCAAALRIGRLARDLIGGTPETLLVEFDRAGSLPTTHDSPIAHIASMGVCVQAPDTPQPSSVHAKPSSHCAAEVQRTSPRSGAPRSDEPPSRAGPGPVRESFVQAAESSASAASSHARDVKRRLAEPRDGTARMGMRR